MPQYEFDCINCGNKVELIQKVRDPAPFCSCGQEMKKCLSQTSFILKGEGWARDLYSKKPPSKIK